jgi:hypothetical protein
MLIAQQPTRAALHRPGDFMRRSRRICTNEQMHMIDSYRQPNRLPPVLGANLANDPFTVGRDLARENALTPLRAPHEVIRHKMHPMLITHINHSTATTLSTPPDRSPLGWAEAAEQQLNRPIPTASRPATWGQTYTVTERSPGGSIAKPDVGAD